MSTALQHTSELEPITASLDCMIAIVFPRSTSKSFPLALRLAQGLLRLEKGTIGGKTYYLACIANVKKDALIAKALLEYTAGWKGTRVFVSGNECPSAFKVIRVLDCYSQAMHCKDPKAHCYVIDDHPVIRAMKSMAALNMDGDTFESLRKQPQYLYPCRLIAIYNNVLQEGHPSSIPDQIQATAVRHSCHWCPLFEPHRIKAVRT